MNPKNETDIQKLIEENVLEALQSKKLKPEQKAELGMKYERHIQTIRLGKLSAIVNVAGLYSPQNREEIAKRIVPPKYDLIDSDAEFIPKTTLNEVAESIRRTETEKREAYTSLMESEKMVGTLKTKIDDLKDEIAIKDRQKLQTIKEQEYDLKRDY